MNYKNINSWIFVSGFFMSCDVMSMTQEEIFKLKKEKCRQCRKQEYELLKAWKCQVDACVDRTSTWFPDYFEYSRAYKKHYPFDFDMTRDLGSIENFKLCVENWFAYHDKKNREMMLHHDSLDCKYAREKYERKVSYCNILELEKNLELPENNE